MDESEDLLSTILNYYKLMEEDCEKQVSDAHFEDISRSNCEHWRSLPSKLKMEAIVVSDIERELTNEEERRLAFFKRWKKVKGFEATYKALITALLEIKCRQDAENICKVLKKSFSSSESSQQATSSVPQRPETTQETPYKAGRFTDHFSTAWLEHAECMNLHKICTLHV